MPDYFTEGRHAAEFIMSEGQRAFSRENVVIGSSQDFQAGQVLARKAVPASVVATPSAASSNTGNATIAMGTPAVTSKVKDGRYKGIATAATTVRWEDPDGKEVGSSTHGSAFAKGGVSFTITAGATPNVAGDEFFVDVAADAADFQFVAHDPAATDGSEDAVAVAIYGAKTGVSETVKAAILARHAEVNGHSLGWDADITAGQKADAIQALERRGIIVR